MKPPGVLICEDEGLPALQLRTILVRLGYRVVGEARDGEEAVAAAAQLQPDAILMDIRMPKLDGIAATEQIMRARPTAIVVVTAYSERELVDAALEAGASGYLVKPVREDQIEPALRVALSRFAVLRELQSELTDLKQALEARKLVERARGILMLRFELAEEDAHRRLQRMSSDRCLSLHKTAEQVVAAVEYLA